MAITLIENLITDVYWMTAEHGITDIQHGRMMNTLIIIAIPIDGIANLELGLKRFWRHG